MPAQIPLDQLHTKSISIRFTNPLYEKLEQIAQKKGYRQHGKPNVSEVIREAVRQYIDHQEDVIGSRAHFSKTLRDSLDQTQTTILAQLEDLTNQVNKLLVHQTPPSSSTNQDTLPGINPKLLMTELHTIVQLGAYGFSSLFALIPGLKQHADITELVDASIAVT